MFARHQVFRDVASRLEPFPTQRTSVRPFLLRPMAEQMFPDRRRRRKQFPASLRTLDPRSSVVSALPVDLEAPVLVVLHAAVLTLMDRRLLFDRGDR